MMQNVMVLAVFKIILVWNIVSTKFTFVLCASVRRDTAAWTTGYFFTDNVLSVFSVRKCQLNMRDWATVYQSHSLERDM